MTCNIGKQKIVSGIAASLVFCTLMGPLQAQDDTRTRAEVAKACEEKVQRIHAIMQQWASQERYPTQVHDMMHAEFFPRTKAGKYREAEEVADRVLALLKKGPPIQKPKDLKEYLRKTEETQYLILPVPETGHLYSGQTESVWKAIERTIDKIGKAEDVKKRNWGFHLIIPAWRFDPKHSPTPGQRRRLFAGTGKRRRIDRLELLRPRPQPSVGRWPHEVPGIQAPPTGQPGPRNRRLSQ